MQPSSPLDPELEDEAWESSPAQDGPPSPHSPGRREGRLTAVTRFLWNPVPIPHPEIDPDLPEMSWPERTAEALRYAVLCVEHWLSQGGILREWLRLNLWLAVILAVAAILVVPPVTAVLQGAAEWTALGGEILANISTAIMSLPPIVLALATVLLIARLLQRHWLRRRHEQQRYRHHDGYDGFQ